MNKNQSLGIWLVVGILVLALASMYPELTVGRIVSQEKGLYRIATSKGEKLAEVSGKFR